VPWQPARRDNHDGHRHACDGDGFLAGHRGAPFHAPTRCRYAWSATRRPSGAAQRGGERDTTSCNTRHFRGRRVTAARARNSGGPGRRVRRAGGRCRWRTPLRRSPQGRAGRVGLVGEDADHRVAGLVAVQDPGGRPSPSRAALCQIVTVIIAGSPFRGRIDEGRLRG
jgi:hypothetical protein